MEQVVVVYFYLLQFIYQINYKNLTFTFSKIDGLINFNDMSTHLGLFYACQFSNCVSYTFIFIFLQFFLKRFLHTVIWYQVYISNTNDLHSNIWYQVFLSNTNNLHIVIWYQVLRSKTTNLHIVVWFHVFLSNTNNLHTVVWFQVFLIQIICT